LGVPKQKAGGAHKNIVLTLVERGGTARSFHVDSTSVADIAPILRENICLESRLMTDEARHCKEVGREYDSHEAVNQGAYEYAHEGAYQHCSEKHLHRHVATATALALPWTIRIGPKRR
jgi:hypothetical protein